jgi:hypothetical protein
MSRPSQCTSPSAASGSRIKDADDLHDATPIQSHGDADAYLHGIRTTFIGASRLGCASPSRTTTDGTSLVWAGL